MKDDALDPSLCYEAVKSRDARFDGRFVTAVLTTGIYCRPSCPSRTPRRSNVQFYATIAEARAAGFRACLRCRPDSEAGMQEGTAAQLALALQPVLGPGPDEVGPVPTRSVAESSPIRGPEAADVADWALRVGMSPRHLRRLVAAQVGVGPRALLTSARLFACLALLEATDLPVTDVAFASGFPSLRSLEDTTRRAFGLSPKALRHARRHRDPSPVAPALDPVLESASPLGLPLSLRLPVRPPFEAKELLRFLAQRAVPGLEEGDPEGYTYRRVLSLPSGPAVAELQAPAHAEASFLELSLSLTDLADLSAAIAAIQRLCDLLADPEPIAGVLGRDPLLGEDIRHHPGRRVPGHVDGSELAIRAVLGQQVSVAAARTHTLRLVTLYGTPLPSPIGSLRFAFPSPARLAEEGPELPGLRLPASRRRTVYWLARALASGEVPPLVPGGDPAPTLYALRRLPGIGPWTASYIALRALGDPDAFPSQDLGVLRALRERTGKTWTAQEAERRSEPWRPFRAYATLHLWSGL